MRGKSKRNRVVIVVALLLMACGSLFAAPGTSRPIQDFLSRQGTFCLNNPSDPVCVANPDPGVPRFQLWDNSCIGPELAFASVDYAGLAAAYILQNSIGPINVGTTMTGEVTEQPLGDGSAEVKVTLRTRNALAWATADCTGQTSNLIFGYKAGEVLNGSAPSLVDSFLEATFVNPANSQLPDILEFISAARQDTLSLYFHASGKGALRPASGFQEGTRGKLGVDQICSAGGGNFTCSTAEVEVKAQGK